MSNVSILDCTLRDGGYCNKWLFGEKNIRKILFGLSEAKIDYVECGYLSNRSNYRNGSSIYRCFNDIEQLLSYKSVATTYVLMINYGEYLINDIPEYSGGKIKGIRLAFHKNQMEDAIKCCKEIQKKGYQLFVQPMVSLSYTDEELLRLINQINLINPFAFYIVDSFGIMKRKDLIRLFYMIEHNLNSNVTIGYHSHNNMQLAYSNAQSLVDICIKRNLIIDTSIYGMGRGAGNLNTELFVEYLNDISSSEYLIKPLLSIIDKILSNFYQQNYWGYSLPNKLSAKHNVHPRYASYLDEKKTLTYEAMDDIFHLIDSNHRNHFDKKYIELLYRRYLENGVEQETNLNELYEVLNSKTVLVIAPGQSLISEKDKVLSFIQQIHPIVISINFDYSDYPVDFIFISNLRRYSDLNIDKKKKCILTSNIPSVDAYAKIKYSDFLNNYEAVQDNAGLMLIKFLIQAKVGSVYLAGMDGYSKDSTKNYLDSELTIYNKNAHVDELNDGMSNAIKVFRQQVNIEFVTTSRYINLN